MKNKTFFLQLAEKLREFARWKDVECPYEKVHQVAELLQTYPVMGEEGESVIWSNNTITI